MPTRVPYIYRRLRFLGFTEDEATNAATPGYDGATQTELDDLEDRVTALEEAPAAASFWQERINDPLSATTNLTTQTGTWAVNSGVVRQTNAGATGRLIHNTVTTPNGMLAAEVECAYISGSGTRRIGLIYRADSGLGEHQILYLESSNGTTWTLKSERDGAGLLINPGLSTTYNGTGYIKLGIVATSAEFYDVYLNGTHFRTTTAANITQLNFNKVGLYTAGSVVDFRNLKVWGSPLPPW